MQTAETAPTRSSAFPPAVCDVSVTNMCNATCDFCGFANDKGLVRDRRSIDRTRFAQALPILHRRGVRYVNFQGGEPLLHPEIVGLVADTRRAGLHPSLITNGWHLPRDIARLADAGLSNLLVSIDSADMAAHEANRGLRGLGERIGQGLAEARRRRIPAIASVTLSRLAKLADLPDALRGLGFSAVTFSYPRRAPFGSSSLVYSEDSDLIAFSQAELLKALDQIAVVRKRFPVLNPAASVADIQRHHKGEPERFPCVGGHRYFYIDWNLDIWRCEAWQEKLGSVFDLDQIPAMRDHCTACTMSCYRDTSVLMHGAIAAMDAASALRKGEVGQAARTLFQPPVATSLRAGLRASALLLRMAKRPTRGDQPADQGRTG